MNNITGYRIKYFTIKGRNISGAVEVDFNTRSEVRRFLITKKDILADYMVFELHDKKLGAVVTKQFEGFR